MNTTLINNFNLKDIENLANDLMKIDWFVNGEIFNLDKLGWKFSFHKKKRVLGTCYKSKKMLSLSLFLIEVNPDKVLWLNVMKHEIAHAIDNTIRGYSDHSGHWKIIAKQIGCSDDLIKSSVKVNHVKGKYSLVCDTCGYTAIRHRELKKNVACGNCCKTHNLGLYSEQFKLKLIKNY